MVYLDAKSLAPTILNLTHWAGERSIFGRAEQFDLIAQKEGQILGSLLKNPGSSFCADAFQIRHHLFEPFDPGCPITDLGPLRIAARDTAWAMEVSGKCIGILANHQSIFSAASYTPYLKIINFHRPQDLRKFQNLNRLILAGFTTIPEDFLRSVPNLQDLESLSLQSFTESSEFAGLEMARNLKNLTISEAHSLDTINAFCSLPKVTELTMRNCESIRDFSPISDLTSLRKLTLNGCDEFQDLSVLKDLDNLEELNLHGLEQLQNLDGIEELPNLTRLSVSWCHRLDSIGMIRYLPKLKDVSIDSCYSVHNFDYLTGDFSHMGLRISHCLPGFSLE